MKKKMMKLICRKCRIEAMPTILPTYEYLEGVPLRNVPAFECPKCKEFVFTPEQVESMEQRTEQLKIHMLPFLRKVTVSGRSLVINIPEDLARHLRVLKGSPVRLTALDDKRFLVEKT